MIRILIADDSGLICDAIRTVLDQEKDIYVVGCARTREEAEFLQGHAGILLVGPALNGESTLEFVRSVNVEDTGKKVIVVGIPSDPELITKYIEAGALGYVSRQESMSRLVEKIRAVNSGQAIVSPDVALHLMQRLAHLAKQPFMGGWGTDMSNGLHELTAREREVLRLIGAGYTNREIADNLVIGWGTVKNHVHNILKKLETNSRHEAAAIYRVHAHQYGHLALGV